MVKIKGDDLGDALLFMSAQEFGNSVFISRETGAVLWQSGDRDASHPLPEDIDDQRKYVKLPFARDLDLGKPLVMRFARDIIPGYYEEIAQIFSGKGAYRRLKNYLDRVGELDRWHAFEAAEQEKALLAWCVDEGFDVE